MLDAGLSSEAPPQHLHDGQRIVPQVCRARGGRIEDDNAGLPADASLCFPGTLLFGSLRVHGTKSWDSVPPSLGQCPQTRPLVGSVVAEDSAVNLLSAERVVSRRLYQEGRGDVELLGGGGLIGILAYFGKGKKVMIERVEEKIG